MNKKNILIVSILILIIVAALIVWRYLPVIKNLIEKPVAKETQEREACKNLCGDGICQEFVCEAVGCPCAETKDNCLQDCNKEQEKNKEEACIAAGGKVAKNSCCKAVKIAGTTIVMVNKITIIGNRFFLSRFNFVFSR